MNAVQGGDGSGGGRVALAAHTHRGGIGDWMRLNSAALADPDTQVLTCERATCGV
jgi:hypothetical protein